MNAFGEKDGGCKMLVSSSGTGMEYSSSKSGGEGSWIPGHPFARAVVRFPKI